MRNGRAGTRARLTVPWPSRPVQQLLEASGATANRDVLRDILRTAAGLAGDGADRLDLKITAAALKEMRAAFAHVRPCKGSPKVTIFGSARTRTDDPLYDAGPRPRRSTSPSAGWMVVTGAGPGIMAAGTEGAGPERSIGVSIRLPFEEQPNEIIAGDDQLVAMKYFFTRKLMLIKEIQRLRVPARRVRHADETFELLTLLQTGKADAGAHRPARRARRHLLEALGGVRRSRARRRRASSRPRTTTLFLVTDDVDEAVDEIQRLLAQLPLDPLGRRSPGDPPPPPAHRRRGRRARRARSPISSSTARSSRASPLPAEVADRDELDLPRLAMRFDPRRAGRLRSLIDALNELPSAGR